MDRIFISYRRTDSAGHTGRLHDRLVDHFGAHRTFLDIDHIEPGVDFVETIDSTLRHSLIVLVVIGPRWLEADDNGRRRIHNDADFHRLEVQRAIELRRRIIPVLTGGAAMPGRADLPEELQSLARRNAFELSDKRFAYDAARLIELIERAFEQEQLPGKASPDRAAEAVRPRPAAPAPVEQVTESPAPSSARWAPEARAPLPDRALPPEPDAPDPDRPLFSGFLLLIGGALLLFLASRGFQSEPTAAWSWPSLVAGVILIALFIRWTLGRASER